MLKRKVVLLVLATVVAVSLFVLYEKRATASFFLREAVYAPRSVGSTSAFYMYWWEYLSKLRFNPELGTYDFSAYLEKNRGRLSEFEHARVVWHQGNFAQAVELINSYHEEHKASESSLFWLALSYLRLAEAQNCLAPLIRKGSPHSGNLQGMCTLPLEVHHRKKLFSHKAADLFEELLDFYDEKNHVWRWLLNFCYMTTGGYPDEVPARYRLETDFSELFYGPTREALASKYANLRFVDRAAELNVDLVNAGKGAAVEDFDGDGFLDIVTGGIYVGLRYHRNDAGQGFLDETTRAGLEGLSGTHLISAADYDNDGWIDILASRPFGSPLGTVTLMRNQGHGTFTDVTDSVGLLTPDAERNERISPWVSAWGDVDNDGDLDLFLCAIANFNFIDWRPMVSSRFYLNEGGTFRDASPEFGLARLLDTQPIVGATFGDYDNDGYVDLLLTSAIRGKAALLRNQAGRSFAKAPVDMPRESTFMASFVDVDHDGWLDFALSGLAYSGQTTAMVVFGERDDFRTGHNHLYRQTAPGRFAPMEAFTNELPTGAMAFSFGDLNNDGVEDFYFGTGNPEGTLIIPNAMYVGETRHGQATGRWDNVSMLTGFGTVQKGHGIVFFDFDEDGDQDIFSSLGGMWPGDVWPNQLLVNESQVDTSWVKIRLRGTRSNVYGLGAKIKVVAQDAAGRSLVRHYHMDNKSGFGSAPYLAHVGLGAAQNIDHVEVRWLGTTEPETYRATIRELNVLVEGEGAS